MNCRVGFGKTDELRRPLVGLVLDGGGVAPKLVHNGTGNDRQILSQHSNGPFANLERAREREKERRDN